MQSLSLEEVYMTITIEQMNELMEELSVEEADLSYYNPWSSSNVEARHKIKAHKSLSHAYLQDKLARIKQQKQALDVQKSKWRQSVKAAHTKYTLDVGREQAAQRFGFGGKILKSQATHAKELQAAGLLGGRGRPRKEPLAATVNRETADILHHYNPVEHGDILDVSYRDITHERPHVMYVPPVEKKVDDFSNIKSANPQLELGKKKTPLLLGIGH